MLSHGSRAKMEGSQPLSHARVSRTCIAPTNAPSNGGWYRVLLKMTSPGTARARHLPSTVRSFCIEQSRGVASATVFLVVGKRDLDPANCSVWR